MDKNKNINNCTSNFQDTPTIIIPLSEYEYLLSRDTRLTKLEDNGVDNWEWCDECFKDDEE